MWTKLGGCGRLAWATALALAVTVPAEAMGPAPKTGAQKKKSVRATKGGSCRTPVPDATRRKLVTCGALASYDSNHDGVVNGSDAGYATLKCFVDSNGDQKIGPGERFGLSQCGVASISLGGGCASFSESGGGQGQVNSIGTGSVGPSGPGEGWQKGHMVLDRQGNGTDLRQPAGCKHLWTKPNPDDAWLVR